MSAGDFEQVKLFDREDKLVAVVPMPPQVFLGGEPRVTVYGGKRFLEGGGPNSYYKRGEFYEEVPSGNAASQ